MRQSSFLPFLDAEEGDRRLLVAIEQVEHRHGDWIEMAQSIAEDLCRRHGSVTADDVREFVHRFELGEPDHPNAWGVIFQSKRFIPTGQVTRSAVPSRRRGIQRVWRLRLPEDEEERCG